MDYEYTCLNHLRTKGIDGGSCPQGYTCIRAGECAPNPTCKTNGDCAIGAMCSGGKCVRNPATCTSQYDWENNQCVCLKSNTSPLMSECVVGGVDECGSTATPTCPTGSYCNAVSPQAPQPWNYIGYCVKLKTPTVRSVGSECNPQQFGADCGANMMCVNGSCQCTSNTAPDSNGKCVIAPCDDTAPSGYCTNENEQCFSGVCTTQTCSEWSPNCNSCSKPISSNTNQAYMGIENVKSDNYYDYRPPTFNAVVNGEEVLTSIMNGAPIECPDYLNLGQSLCWKNKDKDGNPLIHNLSSSAPIAFDEQSLQGMGGVVGTNFGNLPNQSGLQLFLADESNIDKMSPDYCAESSAMNSCKTMGTGAACAEGTIPVNITGWKPLPDGTGSSATHYSVWGCQNTSTHCPDGFWPNMVYDASIGNGQYVVACQRIPLPNTYSPDDSDPSWCHDPTIGHTKREYAEACTGNNSPYEYYYRLDQAVCGDDSDDHVGGGPGNAPDISCANDDKVYAFTKDVIGTKYPNGIPAGFYYNRWKDSKSEWARCTNPNGCKDYTPYYSLGDPNEDWQGKGSQCGK